MDVVLLLTFTIGAVLFCVGGYWLGVRNGRAGSSAVLAGARATGMMLFLLFVVQLNGILGMLVVAAVPGLYLLGWFRARESLRASAGEPSIPRRLT